MRYKSQMSTWLNPDIEYLFNAEIIEYDVRDAGFSIIQQYHLLDKDTIMMLSKLTKQERHIAVGKIQGRDKAFSQEFMKKFAEVRKVFLLTNDVDENEIISVKRDAFFLTRPCKRLQFGKVQFRPKSTYSSYLRFSNNHNIEIYYGDGLEIKGMSDLAVGVHRLYLLEFIKTIINAIETQDLGIRRYLTKFISDYKAHRLDDGYYVEFNNISAVENPVFNYQHLIVPLVSLVLKEIV